MTEYAVRGDTTPPADLSGAAISHVEVRWLVSDVRNGAELTAVGQVGLDDDGLPFGVQLTAAWDDELTAAPAAESIAVNLGWPPLTVEHVEGSSR